MADPHVHAGDDTDVVRTLPAEAAVGSLFRHRVRAYVAALRRRGLRSPRDFVGPRTSRRRLRGGGWGQDDAGQFPLLSADPPSLLSWKSEAGRFVFVITKRPRPDYAAEVVSLRARKRRACRDAPPRGVFGGSSACHEKVCPPWKCGANIAGSCWSLGTKQPRYWECGATRRPPAKVDGPPPWEDRAPVASPAERLSTHGTNAGNDPTPCGLSGLVERGAAVRGVVVSGL